MQKRAEPMMNIIVEHVLREGEGNNYTQLMPYRVPMDIMRVFW